MVESSKVMYNQVEPCEKEVDRNRAIVEYSRVM